jgi:hypothetical protein
MGVLQEQPRVSSREVLTKYLGEYYTELLPQADVDWGGPELLL